jgi:4-hydroxybenzoate polyprenyltransferase
MRYAVIIPWLEYYGLTSAVSTPLFVMLVVAVILIAAGGYIINDFFDTKIDALNNPDKVIVGNTVSREIASKLHQILSVAGALIGLFVAFLSKSFSLGFIFLVVPGLLWFYSASYKRQFLIGNIIIAFCSALVPICVLLPEETLQISKYSLNLLAQTPVIPTLYKWILGFSAFAFLTTLIREIIKDMQDEYGDRELECRTMPVVWGFGKTKIFLCVLIAATLFLISFAVLKYINFPNDTVTLRYLIFGVFLPYAILLYLLIRAKTPSAYGQAATFMKFIMIIGMLYSIVLYIILALNYNIAFFGLRLTM